MILLIAIPLLLRVIGIFCEKRDSRLLQCTATAAAVFIICGLPAFAGFWDNDYYGFGSEISGIPFDSLAVLYAAPAKTLLMKLCAFFSDDPAAYPLVTAGLNALLAGCAVRRAPYHGSAVLCFMFIPAFFFRSGVFTAALICTIAAEYARERRFFRYAALVIAAACFDMSALLILPFYFVTLIPGVIIPTVTAAISAVLAGIFPNALDGVFESFRGRIEYASTPVLWAVIACAATVLCLLMYAMLKNREGRYERLLPLMVCGAALTIAAIFDTRLYAPAIILIMQSAVPLADEVYAIGSKFVGIVFKEKEKAARGIFFAVCVITEAALCAVLVFTDAFGASAYDVAVKTVFGL